MIKTFGQYAKMRGYNAPRNHTREWFTENQNEGPGAGVGPSIGNVASHDMGTLDGNTGNGDVRNAFKDLYSELESSLGGPTGSNVLNAMVNTVMGDPQVPERVKQVIRQKVEERWSHVVDLSDSPPGQGPGLGNIPGGPTPPQGKPDPSLNNVVVPNTADAMGIGGH